MTPAEKARLAQDGIAALRAGDAHTARARFSQLPDPPWMLLAQACNRLADTDGELAALQSQLAEDFRHLPALLAAGELHARLGDQRAASSFFRTAIAQAAVSNIPAPMLPLIERARQFVAASGDHFHQHLLDSLSTAGLLDGPGHSRMRHAIDLLSGKVPLYLQQPSMFYFPGLPQRAFYERDEFAWLAQMEAEIPAMRAELLRHLEKGAAFRPYIETLPGLPAPNNPLRDSTDWSAHYFLKGGLPVPENASRCPATMKALEIPQLPEIAGRSPVALWSILKPDTHIAPHHGLFNTRLICHIPLIIPPDCALRVGAETRAWEDGKALIFDDSFEHEAWNRSDQTRIILLFPIWRPEISEDEKAALSHLFAAINRFGSNPPATDSY
ncbi:hypothetical protein BH10PSE12_BH10PSE12_09280 [soil metagenome]